MIYVKLKRTFFWLNVNKLTYIFFFLKRLKYFRIFLCGQIYELQFFVAL